MDLDLQLQSVEFYMLQDGAFPLRLFYTAKHQKFHYSHCLLLEPIESFYRQLVDFLSMYMSR